MGDNGNGKTNGYSADSFEILTGLEPIRRDPNMYINSTGVDGILQLLIECIDNTVDESKVLKGVKKVVGKISLKKDGTAVIEDNGRGIPVDINKKYGIPAVYISFEHIHGGSKLIGNVNSSYSSSIGVHGVGLSCVNALSENLVVTIKQDGKVYQCEYNRGDRVKDLTVIGKCKKDETGTTIKFKFDNSIMTLTDSFFGKVEYPFNIGKLRTKLERYVLFNDNIEFILDYEIGDTKEKEVFSSEDYNTEDLIKNSSIDGFYLDLYDENKDVGYSVRTLLTVSDPSSTNKMSAVNGLFVGSGGVHTQAIEKAIFEYVYDIFKSKGLLDPDYPLVKHEVLNKVSYIIQLTTEVTAFQGQVKNYFDNPEVGFALTSYYKAEIQEADNRFIGTLVDTIRREYKNRVDFNKEEKIKKENKKSKLNIKKQKELLSNFFDCEGTRKSKNECWFIEGGSASVAFNLRNKKYQAFAKLKGKLINTAKANPDKIKNNEQFLLLQSIIQLNKFGKYILCTDADIDGLHIRSLFIKIMIDWFPEIIKDKQLYIALAPLYRLEYRGKILYAYSEKEKKDLVESGAKVSHRFKGLGEMNSEELFEHVVTNNRMVLITHDKSECRFMEGVDFITNDEFVEYLMGRDSSIRKGLVLDSFADDRLKEYMSKKKKEVKRLKTTVDPMLALGHVEKEEIEELDDFTDYTDI